MAITTIPRYHPLITTFNEKTGWWICDGHINTEHSNAVPVDFQDEPCPDRAECMALCEVLNEEEETTDGQ